MKFTLNNGEQFTITVKRQEEQIMAYKGHLHDDNRYIYFDNVEGHKIVSDLSINLVQYQNASYYYILDAESGIAITSFADSKKRAFEQLINGINNSGGINEYIEKIKEGRAKTWRRFGLKENIKSWYKYAFPRDDLSELINDDVTMNDVYNTIASGNGGKVYDVIGVHDSVIRERIFDRLAIVTGMDYDRIYELWIA